MQIIKLDAIDSTNAYLKGMATANPLDDFTVVTTKKQLKGRGQMGTVWETEAGKNLTFSVLKRFDVFSVANQFSLNICVSLALYEVLRELNIPDIKVKWPNDILSGDAKICGILIENILSGKQIQSSVIGIGLNVNQTEFGQLSHVSSLKLLLGNTFDLEELLFGILKKLEDKLLGVEGKTVEGLQSEYEKVLFRKDKPSTFKNQKGELFMGFIRGVSAYGKLIVALEDNIEKEFDLKEIKLLY